LWALFTNRPEGLNASLKFAGRSDLTAGGLRERPLSYPLADVYGRTPVRMLFIVADQTTHWLFLQRTPAFQNARLLCTVRFNNWNHLPRQALTNLPRFCVRYHGWDDNRRQYRERPSKPSGNPAS
jgi:hypothetical protein